MTINNSMVAQIRQDIATEYMAAKWGLSGFAQGTSQHQIISARMARMEEGHQALRALVGEQAIALVAETLETIPERPTRQGLQHLLQQELGDNEETAHLLDWIIDMWATQDELIVRFGAAFAQKVISALKGADDRNGYS